MKKDYNQIITDQVLDLMTKHGSDWTKPWQAKASLGHCNVITGKPYQGTNIFLAAVSAMANDFKSSEWATFKQWQKKNAKVKKGSKGTPIIFFDRIAVQDKDTDEDRIIPVLKGFTVFNADQVDGYNSPVSDPIVQTKDRNQKAEALIKATGADIRFGGDRAFYSPSHDFVQMPILEDFKGTETSSDIEAYYSTMFHELTHWTGAKTRLDRKKGSKFGSNAYAFEELIAELGAVFITCQLGINVAPRVDHAKYLNNWLEVIKSDKKAMIKAFASANKASEFILAFQNQQDLAA